MVSNLYLVPYQTWDKKHTMCGVTRSENSAESSCSIGKAKFDSTTRQFFLLISQILDFSNIGFQELLIKGRTNCLLLIDGERTL